MSSHDDDRHGGAWGGSEYLGGGTWDDMLKGGQALSPFKPFIAARGLVSALILIFFIIILAYLFGSFQMTTAGMITFGVYGCLLGAASLGLDLYIIFHPETSPSASSVTSL
jgi:hypothetical protein